jgi:hypothetical protein
MRSTLHVSEALTPLLAAQSPRRIATSDVAFEIGATASWNASSFSDDARQRHTGEAMPFERRCGRTIAEAEKNNRVAPLAERKAHLARVAAIMRKGCPNLNAIRTHHRRQHLRLVADATPSPD